MKNKRVDIPHSLVYILNCAYALAKSESHAHAIVKFHINLWKQWRYTV